MFSRRPEIGELSHELFVFTEITWKVPRAYILGNGVDGDIQSPPFSFAGATWNLHVWPYGHTFPNSIGWIDLGIERLDSQIPEHHLFCKFHFKTHRGKEFEPLQESFTFNANLNVDWIMFAEKENFLPKEKIIMRDGVFTVVCQLRTPKINGIEALSQTEVVELVTELPDERSRQKPESCPSTRCKGCDNISQNPVTYPDDKILEDFKELFLNQEDCDVIIKVKGQEFSAHRTILRARSSVFASTFRNNMKEKVTGIIDIEDCEPSSFSDFLYFLYCGKVKNLTTENVFSLFTTADKYDVQGLRSQCLEFMKMNLSVDTFCETITLALQHFEQELVTFATDFFAKNFQEIIVTVKWQSFLVENPIQGNEIMIKALVLKK